jgi:hypothetical protein
MSQFRQTRPVRRAPRVSLRQTIPATILLENGRQLSAKLLQLSITGGLLELSTCLEERTWVGLGVPIGFSAIHFTAEMMFPMRSATGYLQPFRITRIPEADLHALDKEITSLLKQAATAPTQISGIRPLRFYLESF